MSYPLHTASEPNGGNPLEGPFEAGGRPRRQGRSGGRYKNMSVVTLQGTVTVKHSVKGSISMLVHVLFLACDCNID